MAESIGGPMPELTYDGPDLRGHGRQSALVGKAEIEPPLAVGSIVIIPRLLPEIVCVDARKQHDDQAVVGQ